MSRLIKKMAFLCRIQGVNLKCLEDEHEFVIGENLREKVTFVLADPPYDVRSEHHLNPFVSCTEELRP